MCADCDRDGCISPRVDLCEDHLQVLILEVVGMALGQAALYFRDVIATDLEDG